MPSQGQKSNEGMNSDYIILHTVVVQMSERYLAGPAPSPLFLLSSCTLSEQLTCCFIFPRPALPLLGLVVIAKRFFHLRDPLLVLLELSEALVILWSNAAQAGRLVKM